MTIVMMDWRVLAVTNGEDVEVVAIADQGRAKTLASALVAAGVAAIACKTEA